MVSESRMMPLGRGGEDCRLSSVVHSFPAAISIFCSFGRALVGALCVLSCALLTGARPALGARPQVAGSTALPGLSKGDTDLLDDISRRSFRYFWDQTDLSTGLVADRARTDGEPEDNPNHVRVASIAATGFGLTAFCIAADHRWISREMARERVLAALVYFTDRAPEEHGWFYHYLDPTTGERR